MEEFGSLWTYQEESVDELKQKLLCTTLELEQVKMVAGEEMRKNKEYVKQLMQLFKMACQERDQAREQLQKMMNKVNCSTTNQPELLTSLPQFQPESPLLMPTKANSSITESNSLSETYNYHSHGSSPGDSFFDNVSSPELSNINMGDSISIPYVNQSFVQTNSTTIISNGIPKLDHASLVIENLAKGKNLPMKGKFMKAVLESGPLLQSLLVAGPLPRWRNPPQLQTIHIPPVSIKGCEADMMSLKTAPNMSPIASSRPMATTRPYAEMSCASSQILSNSTLNFTNGASGSFLGSERLISTGTNANSYVPLGKRQRFC